jgi:preprotein translocase subunit SecA
MAIHSFRRDEHYLVRDGKVQIIDGNTGRILADRSWERGLQQMIEVSEGCEPTPPRESLARITYQRFFRRYLRLGAASGTAREVAAELWAVYRLRVCTVPSHRPTQRVRLGRHVHGTVAQQQRHLLERIQLMRWLGRPVLVGTRSVAASEQLSAMLTAANLQHAVLNARQDHLEAEIVAMAGQAGRITIATNMAGRGTDIQLDAGVLQAGGLHVIATELNESRRIDRQLFGRSGRQGDPGSYESVHCADDALVEESGLQALVATTVRCASRLPIALGWLNVVSLALVQWSAEGRSRRSRRLMWLADQRMSKDLSFSGPME